MDEDGADVVKGVPQAESDEVHGGDRVRLDGFRAADYGGAGP
jgi:hypothetical protein